ncbi:MAG: hypothetical protein R3C59_10215 [Planctomycetaceae bacterium]
MAIEFNCPYCTAAIRVPDQFSGKRGTCPKCDTRLIVPDVAPKSAAVPSPTAPPPESALPPSVVPPGSPEFRPADSVPSVSRSLRRKQRRKKSRQVYSVGIPLLCFAAFFGLLAVLYVFRTPELKGTLRGSVAAGMPIPRATVPLASLTLSADEQTQAADAFTKSPESFVSPRMTCSVGAEGRDLTVDVQSGDGYVWITLNPRSDANLSAWIHQNTAALNRMRLSRIAATGAELCRDKILKSTGTSVVFAAEKYRDDFALNAHLGAFGFAVEAIAGRNRSPCVHEDSNGTLYFAMPEGTTTLTLRGRSVLGGKPLFPGEYSVTAAPSQPTTPAPDMPVESTDETEPMSDKPDNADSAPAPAGELMKDEQ